MLFVVMLGGRHPQAKIEVHDLVFVEGEKLSDCYDQLRSSWFGLAKGMHIDSWMTVDGVDGYQLRFTDKAPAPTELKLFLLNYGGYLPGGFGEEHQYVLQLAHNAAEAKQLGKQRYPALWQKPHTDAVIDIDDCLLIDKVNGQYLQLLAGEHLPVQVASDYIVLA